MLQNSIHGTFVGFIFSIHKFNQFEFIVLALVWFSFVETFLLLLNSCCATFENMDIVNCISNIIHKRMFDIEFYIGFRFCTACYSSHHHWERQKLRIKTILIKFFLTKIFIIMKTKHRTLITNLCVRACIRGFFQFKLVLKNKMDIGQQTRTFDQCFHCANIDFGWKN